MQSHLLYIRCISIILQWNIDIDSVVYIFDTYKCWVLL